MIKRILVSLVLAALLAFGVAGVASAGGGPAPECYTDYNGFPWAIHANAGEVVYMEVYITSCPAVATTDWGSGQVELFRDDQSNASSWQYFQVPQNVPNDTSYIISLDSTNGTVTYHKEARLVVGNPPVSPLKITLSMKRAYWENYAAYQARILLIDYVLSNIGTNDAYVVQVGERSPTNGVIALSNPFGVVTEKIPAGGKLDPHIRGYLLPPGVSSFRTTLGVRAEDIGGNAQDFGSLPPGV